MEKELVVLAGRISLLQSKLLKADFFISPESRGVSGDEPASGVLAVAAAALGMSGVAIGAAISSSSRLEEADRVSFDLNGEPVQAWLWRNPFADGDEVEIVASRVGTHWEALAVARPSDRIVALYPHLSRGKKAHLRYAAILWLKTMFWFTVLLLLFFFLSLVIGGGFSALGEKDFILFFLSCGLPVIWGILVLPAIHLTWRWMYFVRIAEDVFRTFGWSGVENIDLMKASKGGKAPDVFGYGYLYYRY